MEINENYSSFFEYSRKDQFKNFNELINNFEDLYTGFILKDNSENQKKHKINVLKELFLNLF